jgi:hypothetical protein
MALFDKQAAWLCSDAFKFSQTLRKHPPGPFHFTFSGQKKKTGQSTSGHASFGRFSRARVGGDLGGRAASVREGTTTANHSSYKNVLETDPPTGQKKLCPMLVSVRPSFIPSSRT